MEWTFQLIQKIMRTQQSYKSWTQRKIDRIMLLRRFYLRYWKLMYFLQICYHRKIRRNRLCNGFRSPKNEIKGNHASPRNVLRRFWRNHDVERKNFGRIRKKKLFSRNRRLLIWNLRNWSHRTRINWPKILPLRHCPLPHQQRLDRCLSSRLLWSCLEKNLKFRMWTHRTNLRRRPCLRLQLRKFGR